MSSQPPDLQSVKSPTILLTTAEFGVTVGRQFICFEADTVIMNPRLVAVILKAYIGHRDPPFDVLNHIVPGKRIV